MHKQSGLLDLLISLYSSLSFPFLVRTSYGFMSEGQDHKCRIAGVECHFLTKNKTYASRYWSDKQGTKLIGHLLHKLSHSSGVSLCDSFKKWKLGELKWLALRLSTELSHRDGVWTRVQKSETEVLYQISRSVTNTTLKWKWTFRLNRPTSREGTSITWCREEREKASLNQLHFIEHFKIVVLSSLWSMSKVW